MSHPDLESTGCCVASPNLVYAWPSRTDFDRLALTETVHDWAACKTTTLIRNDGQKWARRCHSKTMDGGPVMVIFQVFDERPVETDCSEVPA